MAMKYDKALWVAIESIERDRKRFVVDANFTTKGLESPGSKRALKSLELIDRTIEFFWELYEDTQPNIK